MEHSDFIELVRDRLASPSLDDAERATRATLETLGQRLPADEAENLAAQLPGPLARYLEQTSAQEEEFPVEEFYERVAELEDALPEEAVEHAHAVLGVLDDAVSTGELADVISRLPSDYSELLAEAAT